MRLEPSPFKQKQGASRAEGSPKNVLLLLDQIFHGADPLVIGVIGTIEALILAGHQPQEIGVVAGRAHGGMITPGELHQLVVFDPVGLVDLAVGGIQALHAEALLRTNRK